MECPRDKSVMVERRVDGVAIDFCQRCGGIWLDWGELRGVAGVNATEEELIFRGKSTLSCPRCGKRMNQSDLHSVIVDDCRCGIFFDGGEAEKAIGKRLLDEGSEAGETLQLTRAHLRELLDRGAVRVGGFNVVLED